MGRVGDGGERQGEAQPLLGGGAARGCEPHGPLARSLSPLWPSPACELGSLVQLPGGVLSISAACGGGPGAQAAP